jgi:hypothetical protein
VLAPPRTPDDVLMAMDVVDTLRHRKQLVARELDTEGREAELIARLREIYAAQGIEVPDAILRDGVKALEEQRFVYTPPAPSLSVSLARIYIARDRWLKPMMAGLAAVVIGATAWHFGVTEPRQAAALAEVRALEQDLPAALTAAHGAVLAASQEDLAVTQAQALLASGRQALARRDAKGARDVVAALDTLRTDVLADYSIRVVYGPDEPLSGVFRIPDNVPDARNYYLIVEAIDASGRPVTVPIRSEEDRKSARVSRWGQRVTQAAFERIAADKGDDQIIQADVIGRKPAGRLTPEYLVETPGGAILEW